MVILDEVRVLTAKKTVDDLFDEGDVYIERFDAPGLVIPKDSPKAKGSLSLQNLDIEKYFTVSTIPAKETEYFKHKLKRYAKYINAMQSELLDIRKELEDKSKFVEKIMILLVENGY